MKDFSKIRIPQINLLKKITKFKWSKKCEEAFRELKRRSTTLLILTLFVGGKEYTIYSDTSKNGLGYVLMQENKVSAYTSRQLKPYEKN